MRLISAGSLVRAQSGPLSQPAFCIAAQLRAYLKLEINKRHWTGCGKEFERQKRANVCRNLNARRLQSQAINKLIAFLRDSQKQ